MARRRRLTAGGTLVAVSFGALALVHSHHLGARVVASASLAGANAPNCAPATLNQSDVLAGTDLAVSPLPGSLDASPGTQISMMGAPVRELSDISVSGSETGTHTGALRGYSLSDGASFVPAKAFTPGETVTVRGDVANKTGKPTSFSYQFTVAYPDPVAHVAPNSGPVGAPGDVQSFHSRPDLKPPSITVSADSPDVAPGYVLAAPYAGPGENGPMIFDDSGQLVWFKPLSRGTQATNLQVQHYEGQPVLTWWQGYIPPQGFGEGVDMVVNDHYQTVAVVKAGNGYVADLHDFELTSQGTALLTVFNTIHCNLAAVGGPTDGAVTDGVFEEIDVKTGLVMREWHSLDHVALSASYAAAKNATVAWPYDYFHLNSIDAESSGGLLISSRSTWSLFQIDTQTGQIEEVIGGKDSSVQMGTDTSTAWQHDATELPDGTISVFDNEATPVEEPQSRGVVLAVNAEAKTATMVRQYVHPGLALQSDSQGDFQTLANGDAFIGWGSEPYFSELSPSGQLLFDAHMPTGDQSYRAFRAVWSATPATTPTLAAVAGSHTTTVYASWDGATTVAEWRVLAGPSAKDPPVVARAPRNGFETAITVPGKPAHIAVQALDSSGAVLATSNEVSP